MEIYCSIILDIKISGISRVTTVLTSANYLDLKSWRNIDLLKIRNWSPDWHITFERISWVPFSTMYGTCYLVFYLQFILCSTIVLIAQVDQRSLHHAFAKCPNQSPFLQNINIWSYQAWCIEDLKFVFCLKNAASSLQFEYKIPFSIKFIYLQQRYPMHITEQTHIFRSWIWRHRTLILIPFHSELPIVFKVVALNEWL